MMANWLTHVCIAESIHCCFPWIDARGFAVGSIAPDCNQENETWTAFVPPREVTHFMTGSSKSTADIDGFYHTYISGCAADGKEKTAFLIGYLAHLMTDVAFQQMIDDEVRVSRMLARIKSHPPYAKRIEGMPETGETVKKQFTRSERMNDILGFEWEWFKAHPDSMYHRCILHTEGFPDYLEFLPHGSIARKIHVMGKPMKPEPGLYQGVFFSEEELSGFIESTAGMIEAYLINKGITKERFL